MHWDWHVVLRLHSNMLFLLPPKNSSSTSIESLHHLQSYLKVWEDVFMLLKERYLRPLTCLLNLCFNLFTWYSAIIRLPAIFSSSRSLLMPSSSYSSCSLGMSFCHPLLLLICIFYVQFITILFCNGFYHSLPNLQQVMIGLHHTQVILVLICWCY